MKSLIKRMQYGLIVVCVGTCVFALSILQYEHRLSLFKASICLSVILITSICIYTFFFKPIFLELGIADETLHLGPYSIERYQGEITHMHQNIDAEKLKGNAGYYTMVKEKTIRIVQRITLLSLLDDNIKKTLLMSVVFYIDFPRLLFDVWLATHNVTVTDIFRRRFFQINPKNTAWIGEYLEEGVKGVQFFPCDEKNFTVSFCDRIAEVVSFYGEEHLEQVNMAMKNAITHIIGNHIESSMTIDEWKRGFCAAIEQAGIAWRISDKALEFFKT